jgi:excisionase family DNA binding protein
MDEHRLLTVREVASALGVSEVTVRRRIDAGELGALQLGGKGTALRVPASELAQFVFGEPDEAA